MQKDIYLASPLRPDMKQGLFLKVGPNTHTCMDQGQKLQSPCNPSLAIIDITDTTYISVIREVLLQGRNPQD